MTKQELYERMSKLIDDHSVRAILANDPTPRSTTVYREDISKTYALRLKHMEESPSTNPAIRDSIARFLSASNSINDKKIRLTIFNDEKTYCAAFTDEGIQQLLGLIAVGLKEEA